MKRITTATLLASALLAISANASLGPTTTLDTSLTQLNQWDRTGPIGVSTERGGSAGVYLGGPVDESHFGLGFSFEETDVYFDVYDTGYDMRQVLVTFDFGRIDLYNVVADPASGRGGDNTQFHLDPVSGFLESTEYVGPYQDESISHLTQVTFYGRRVPDGGGTMLLLGLGLAALSANAIRRRV